jgi:hypothetical protein
MNMMKKAFAAASMLALALSGCETQQNQSDGNVGVLSANLTLPSGTTLDSLGYTVSGALLPGPRTGSVDISDSTEVRFRVGALPVGVGYNMALAGTTSAGVQCAGTAPFAIADNQVTTLLMTLICGGDTMVVETDDQGDISVSVVVQDNGNTTTTCPVVTGITALPLETTLGHDLQLAGFATSTTGVSYLWSGSGGVFGTSTTDATAFTCGTAGDHPLTFMISKSGCADSQMGVTVTCTDVAPATGGTGGAGTGGVGGETGGTGGVVTGGTGGAGTGGAGGTGGITANTTCDTCLEAQCRDYQGSGFDLIGACFENADPMLNQLCSDAFYCNFNTLDACKQDVTRGAISCYCGASVALGASCQTGTGPQGPCQDEWEAATGCESLEAGTDGPTTWGCTQNLFADPTLQSGVASYMTQCKDVSCQTECAGL